MKEALAELKASRRFRAAVACFFVVLLGGAIGLVGAALEWRLLFFIGCAITTVGVLGGGSLVIGAYIRFFMGKSFWGSA